MPSVVKVTARLTVTISNNESCGKDVMDTSDLTDSSWAAFVNLSSSWFDTETTAISQCRSDERYLTRTSNKWRPSFTAIRYSNSCGHHGNRKMLFVPRCLCHNSSSVCSISAHSASCLRSLQCHYVTRRQRRCVFPRRDAVTSQTVISSIAAAAAVQPASIQPLA